MPWPCRLLPEDEWRRLQALPGPFEVGGLQVGDMHFAPWWRPRSLLAPEYIRDWATRRDPIEVIIPGPICWCVDVRATDKATGKRLDYGWTVTGQPPRITLTPSVDTSGPLRPNGWHGWIKDGVIT